MSTQTNQQKPETVKVEKSTQNYYKMNELLSDHIDKVKKFKKLPCTFMRTFSAKNVEQVSIRLNVHDQYLRSLVIKDGVDYITVSRFNNIALNLDLRQKNERGYDITEWNYNVPVRFIKGITSQGNEYKAVQVVLGREDFFTHLFKGDDLSLLNNLEKKKLLKIDWIESPEKLSEDIDISLD
jgi:hypothetical protein